MRISKQIQGLPLFTQMDLPTENIETLPNIQPPSSENKFKVLKKTFLLNKTKFRQIIKRDTETSFEWKRKMKEVDGKKASTPQYLISLKKTYNNMSIMAFNKQIGNKMMKEKIEKMKNHMTNIQKESEEQQQHLSTLESNYISISDKQQSTTSQTKVLQNILERMKSDQILDQTRIDQLESKLAKVKNQLKYFENKKRQLEQSHLVYHQISRQIKSIYVESAQKRDQDLLQYQKRLKQMKQDQLKQQEKNKISQTIQALATSDLNDANTLKWRKLLFSQLVVRKMLKFKIEHLDKKYGGVKKAFHDIKFKTSIDDPKRILTGFQQLQNTSSNLLANIKFLEDRQKQLREEKKILQGEYQQQQERQYEILQSKQVVDQFQEISLARKTKEIALKCLGIELLQQKLYHWWYENENRFHSLEAKPKMDINLPLSSHKLVEHFISFCDSLVERHSNLNSCEQSKDLNITQLRSLQNVIYETIRKNENEVQLKDTEPESLTRTRI